MTEISRAILLINLGSPDTPSVSDVKKYLKQFLMDERVIDIPPLARWLLLNLIILPRRPRQSAHAYQSIWWENGSPLVVISQEVTKKLKETIEIPIELAMRYGQPSVKNALSQLFSEKIDELYLLPLYPHYAMSSTETALEHVMDELKALNVNPSVKVLPPFYEDPLFIQSLVENAREFLEKEYDHLLFSYHGLPFRHLTKTDPTQNHCQIATNCCEVKSKAINYCYRAQVLKTTKAFVKSANIPEDKYSVSFQSRLGRTPWLTPFTDFVIPELAKKGVKKLLVICPSFVSDCLETLEEIGIRAKELFIEAGGEELTLIPCLNTHPLWIETLNKWCRSFNDFEPIEAVKTATFNS